MKPLGVILAFIGKYLWIGLQWAGRFLLKNWRWFLPALVFFAWALIPNKTFIEALSFVAGIILMGFAWYAYTHYIKNKPVNPPLS